MDEIHRANEASIILFMELPQFGPRVNRWTMKVTNENITIITGSPGQPLDGSSTGCINKGVKACCTIGVAHVNHSALTLSAGLRRSSPQAGLRVYGSTGPQR
eukprot:1644278-Pyramimonas_sp.AAC.1